VNRVGDRLGRREHELRGPVPAHRPQVLGEGERVQIEELHPADREGDLGQGELQQGARRDDVESGALLVEVAKRHERAGTGLDLVEEEERPPRRDLLVEHEPQLREQPAGVQVALEDAMPAPAPLEVDRGQLLEMLRAEPLDGPGLPHLPGAAEEQRLAPVGGLPGQEIRFDQSFHARALRNIGVL